MRPARLTQTTMPRPTMPIFRRTALASLPLLLAACAHTSIPQLDAVKEKLAKPVPPAVAQETMAPIQEREDTLLAVTDGNVLISFNGGTPGEVASRAPLKGLKPGELLLAIDYRASLGQLYGLSNAGRVLRIDPATAIATPLGTAIRLPEGDAFSLDVDPATDQLRLVSDQGANLRLHPASGAVIDGDPKTAGVQPDAPLAYQPGDLLAGNRPRIVAAASVQTNRVSKSATHYVIDAATGYLALLGSPEGAREAVSADSGRLQSIGPLGIDHFDRAVLDITAAGRTAYLVTTRIGSPESRLYELNLASGQARLIGAIAAGQIVRGMAIAP